MRSEGVIQASGDPDRIAFALSAMLKLGGTGIPDMMTGKDIAARRQAMDMTQGHLAGAAGVSRSTVQRAERGLPISAESMRSIRSVLGLKAEVAVQTSESPVPIEPTPAVRGPRRPCVWAWYADPALVMPLIAFTVFEHALVGESLDAVAWVRPGLYMRSLQFYAVMAALLLTVSLVTLSGRILWRRLRHPSADCLVIGMGGNVRRETAWAGGRVSIRRWPVPVVRWSSQGRFTRTWPGAVLAMGLVPVAIMALHMKPVAQALSVGIAYVGYSDVREIVPAWRIDPDSPLAAAGFRLGDRVVSIGGVPVREYMEVWPAIRDGREDGIEVVVQRAGRSAEKLPYSVPTSVETLYARPQIPEGVQLCPEHISCRWIGDVTGFISTQPRPPTAAEFLRRFGQELMVVGAMAADPSLAADIEYDGITGSVSTWVRWIVFESAANTGIRGLAFLMALLVLGASLLPPLNRAVRPLAKAARRFPGSAIPAGQAYAQA